MDWTIAPSLINEVRVGHQSAGVDFNRPGRLEGPTVISNLYNDPYNAAFAQGRNSPVNEITDYLTKVHGAHNLKFGGNLRMTNNGATTWPGPRRHLPERHHGHDARQQRPAHRRPHRVHYFIGQPDHVREPYNDVLGRMNQVVQSYFSDLNTFQPAGSSRIRDFHVKELGFFAQDDWKIRPRLALNLGMRWEYSGIPKPKPTASWAPSIRLPRSAPAIAAAT